MASKKYLQELFGRLEKQISRLEKIKQLGGGGGGGGGGGAVSEDGVAKWFSQYNDFKPMITKFVNSTSALGGNFKGYSQRIVESFGKLEKVLKCASTSKKPKLDVQKTLFKPISVETKYWDDEAFKFKGKKEGEHLQTLNEAFKGLNWVQMREAPFKWVKESFDNSTFYSNKVLRNNKDKKHKEWVRTLKELMMGLRDFVKECHSTGLMWNFKGKECEVGGGDDEDAGGAPPGPPPPCIDFNLDIKPNPNAGEGGDAGAMFDELTSGAWRGKLKKVTKDMKTKYRKDRSGKVPDKLPKKKGGAKKQAKKKFKGKPRFDFEGGKKWIVEYQEKNRDIIIEKDKCHQSQIALVYGCADSLVRINGKLNSISIDSCKKTSVIVQGVVATVEVTNCTDCQVQVQGKAPTISLDKSDGIQLFIAKPSYGADIVVTKCSVLNLCPMTEDDYDEISVPEQFLVKYDPKKKKIKIAPREE